MSELDGMNIQPDVVRSGVAAWDGATRHLGDLQRMGQALTRADLGAIFGADAPGRSFLTSFTADGGPDAVLFGEQGGGAIARQLAESGPAMGQLLDQLLAQDQDRAAAIRAAGEPPAARA